MKWILAIVLLLALLIGAMFILARRNEARAEAEAPPSGKMVDVGGHMVHVEISGSGPPLVLIHGASGNLRDMTFRLVPAISDRFTTISVDRPGLGYTPSLNPRGETLREQGDLMEGLIKALGYDRVYVLGQSYGGSVALNWTLNHPESVAGLVLVSAPSNVWQGGLDPLYKINANRFGGPLLRLVVSAFPPKSIVQSSLAEIFGPQSVPEGYEDHIGIGLTLRRSHQRANALQVAALKSEIRTMVPRYGEISVPVEAVHGTSDAIVPFPVHTEKLAKQIAGIEVTKLDGAGHMPHQTHLSAVVTAIDRLHEKVGLGE